MYVLESKSTFFLPIEITFTTFMETEMKNRLRL